eukprot:2199032-Lingulodinium_polyedra.AAC.1
MIEELFKRIRGAETKQQANPTPLATVAILAQATASPRDAAPPPCPLALHPPRSWCMAPRSSLTRRP